MLAAYKWEWNYSSISKPSIFHLFSLLLHRQDNSSGTSSSVVTLWVHSVVSLEKTDIGEVGQFSVNEFFEFTPYWLPFQLLLSEWRPPPAVLLLFFTLVSCPNSIQARRRRISSENLFPGRCCCASPHSEATRLRIKDGEAAAATMDLEIRVDDKYIKTFYIF